MISVVIAIVISNLSRQRWAISVVWMLLLNNELTATGLTRDGTTARTQALGGASVAVSESPLEAMTSNPAALTEIKHSSLEISVDGVFIRGSFDRKNESNSHLRNRVNILGDVAIAFPTSHSAIHWGVSASPTYAAEANWRYRDSEGGLDGKTTYGEQEQHSTFLVYNFQAGVGVDFSSWFSAGASVGLLYNYNSLKTPYIFQSQKVLQGFKTDLDLETDGFGAVGQFGFTLKPLPNLKISASYTTPTTIHAKGDVLADLSAQLKSLGGGFAAVDPQLRADAEVINHLPQKISVGIAWQPAEHWLLTSQLDWINWAAAFDDLQINLRNSSNPAVNSLVGSDNFTDIVPLQWRDQTILRFGCEYELSPLWKLRFGYSHSSQVVPAETLTPLTGALSEHLLTAGVGYAHPNWHLDFSWQWNLPEKENVGRSLLKSGEYSDSSVKLESHWLGLTYGLSF